MQRPDPFFVAPLYLLADSLKKGTKAALVVSSIVTNGADPTHKNLPVGNEWAWTRVIKGIGLGLGVLTLDALRIKQPISLQHRQLAAHHYLCVPKRQANTRVFPPETRAGLDRGRHFIPYHCNFKNGLIMFNKTSDPTSAPPARVSNTKSTFASDLRITGEVSSVGDIEMMGEIDGNVSARSLIVGGEGRMNGTVSADIVEVKGKLEGQVSAGSFTLRASAQVTADITYRSLIIESGAHIEGRFAKAKD
jgi:cytoskeletal protein CcmA (bactofilin family)